MVMTFYTNRKNATWTPPAGTIEVYDKPGLHHSSTSNMMSYYIQGDPGKTGNLSATASMSEYWVAQAIAIRPLSTTLESARITHSTGDTIPELSVAEEAATLQEGELKAYPNPVKDRLNLNLEGFVEQMPDESSLIILDAMGRMIPWQGVWHEGTRRLELDFSQMHVGFYVINIRTLSGVKTLRVIKKSQ